MPRACATTCSTAPRDTGVPVGLFGAHRYVIFARAATSRSASMSNVLVRGMATGSRPFSRASTGIIEKVGDEKARRSPAAPKARIVESSTSSEPQPVTTPTPAS